MSAWLWVIIVVLVLLLLVALPLRKSLARYLAIRRM